MILPKYRTAKYAIWRACERMGVRPPGVMENFDDNGVIAQADLIAYSQIRENEDVPDLGLRK